MGLAVAGLSGTFPYPAAALAAGPWPLADGVTEVWARAAAGIPLLRTAQPVEAAMVALCAPILVAGIWLMAAGLRADLGPSRTVAGQLEHIDKVGAFGRSFGINLATAASPLILPCRVERNCGSPVPLLRLQPGAKLELELLNGKVLGLKADGRQLVEPAVQRAWRVGFAAAGLVLLLAYGAAFVVASLRLLLDAGEPEPETPTYWTAP